VKPWKNARQVGSTESGSCCQAAYAASMAAALALAGTLRVFMGAAVNLHTTRESTGAGAVGCVQDDNCRHIQRRGTIRQVRGARGSGIAIVLKVGNSGISFRIAAMESHIKASLISLLDGIKRSDGAVIAREMARLDDLLAESRAAGGLHPQLDHFLGNRSYAKALAYLGGEQAALRQGFAGRAENPPGGCTTRTAKPAKG